MLLRVMTGMGCCYACHPAVHRAVHSSGSYGWALPGQPAKFPHHITAYSSRPTPRKKIIAQPSPRHETGKHPGAPTNTSLIIIAQLPKCAYLVGSRGVPWGSCPSWARQDPSCRGVGPSSCLHTTRDPHVAATGLAYSAVGLRLRCAQQVASAEPHQAMDVDAALERVLPSSRSAAQRWAMRNNQPSGLRVEAPSDKHTGAGSPPGPIIMPGRMP